MPAGMQCPYCQGQFYSKRLCFLGGRHFEEDFFDSNIAGLMDYDRYLAASQGTDVPYSPVGIATFMNRKHQTIRKYDRCFFREAGQGYPPHIGQPVEWPGPENMIPMQGMSIERLVRKLLLTTEGLRWLPIDIEEKLQLTGADPIQIWKGLMIASDDLMTEPYRAMIQVMRSIKEDIDVGETKERHFEKVYYSTGWSNWYRDDNLYTL